MAKPKKLKIDGFVPKSSIKRNPRSGKAKARAPKLNKEPGNDDDKDENDTKGGEANNSPDFASINNPDFNDNLEARQPAIGSAKHAYEISTSYQMQNIKRNQIDADIFAAYDGERPKSEEELKQQCIDWVSNVNAQYIKIYVDSIYPDLRKVVVQARYLTAASLPMIDENGEAWPDRDAKNAFFRRVITDTIRSHPDWDDFVSDVSLTYCLLGRAFYSWDDKFSWMPKFYGPDKLMVSDGTQQRLSNLQVAVKLDEYLIHELWELISDKKVAEAAGWNIDNCVKAMNKAMPNNPLKNGQSSPIINPMVYENFITEGVYNYSYLTGAKVINTATVFAQEPEGGVTIYIINSENGNELFFADGRDEDTRYFEKMSDCVGWFLFSRGNGRVQGSKGLGRILMPLNDEYNRLWNNTQDNIFINSLYRWSVPEADRVNAMLTVKFPFLITTAGKEDITSTRDEVDVEGTRLGIQLVEETGRKVVGAYLPQQSSLVDQPTDGKPQSATGEAIDAREQEIAQDNFRSRFLRWLGVLIKAMQKKLCNPEARDLDKYVARVFDMLTYYGLTEEEIDILANSDTIADPFSDESSRRQRILQCCQVIKGDPHYDQDKVARYIPLEMVDEAFADDIIIKKTDQTVVAEAQSKQLLENLGILAGMDMPVSPKDNHTIHIPVLFAGVQKMLPMLQQNPTPEGVGSLNLAIEHAIGHYEYMEQDKTTDPQVLDATKKMITDLQKQYAMLSNQLGGMNPSGNQMPGGQSPQGGAGAPPGAGGPPPGAGGLPPVASSPDLPAPPPLDPVKVANAISNMGKAKFPIPQQDIDTVLQQLGLAPNPQQAPAPIVAPSGHVPPSNGGV